MRHIQVRKHMGEKPQTLQAIMLDGGGGTILPTKGTWDKLPFQSTSLRTLDQKNTKQKIFVHQRWPKHLTLQNPKPKEFLMLVIFTLHHA